MELFLWFEVCIKAIVKAEAAKNTAFNSANAPFCATPPNFYIIRERSEVHLKRFLSKPLEKDRKKDWTPNFHDAEKADLWQRNREKYYKDKSSTKTDICLGRWPLSQGFTSHMGGEKGDVIVSELEIINIFLI